MRVDSKRTICLRKKRKAKLVKHKSNLKLLRTRLEDKELVTNPVKELQILSKACILSSNCKIIPITPDCTSVILAVNGNQLFKVHGQCKISSIRGSFIINGHLFQPGESAKSIYAPISHTAISIKVLQGNVNKNNVVIFPEDLPTDLTSFQELLNEYSVLILCQCISNCNEPKAYPDYKDLYNVKSTGYPTVALCTGCWLCDTSEYFIEHEAYNHITSLLTEPIKCKSNVPYAKSFPVLIATGGKNVGKSTLNRYLINSLLKDYDHVYYLECDIGQSEFTAPGLISIHKINKNNPILGPPFTHNQKPIFSVYYGQSTPVGNPDRYIKSIDFVCYSFFQSLNHGELDGPLIVNTMGWIRALGLNLLIDTIRIICPTHVVQLSSQRESRNTVNLTSDYVSKATGWILNPDVNKMEFEHILIAVEPKKAEVNNYIATDMRHLSIYASFNVMTRNYFDKQSNNNKVDSLIERVLQLPTQSAMLSDLLITNATDISIKSHLALAMLNASIVGLCVISDQEKNDLQEQEKEAFLVQPPPVGNCLGIGIVKCVEPSTGKMDIISDVDITKTNCIIRGSINIPDAFLLRQMNQDATKTGIPYVTSNFPYSTIGSGTFKVFRKFNKFSGNNKEK